MFLWIPQLLTFYCSLGSPGNAWKEPLQKRLNNEDRGVRRGGSVKWDNRRADESLRGSRLNDHKSKESEDEMRVD